MEDYDSCDECREYGDEYSYDENGDLVCNCDECYLNPAYDREHEW